MMHHFLRNHILLILLLFISLVAHWYIFFDSKDLNAGDWPYHFFSTLRDLMDYHIYSSAYGLGMISVFANNWIFYVLYYAFSLIDIGWDTGTRILFLAPIVFLTPIFSFLLFKKIFQNNLIAFFSACVYSFNTFFLKLQLDWLTYAFLWWILPALFLSVINYIETKKYKYLVYNFLLVFLGITYELRIMIFVFCFLTLFQFFYQAMHSKVIRESFKVNFYVGLSLFLGISGHIFWILPLIKENILSDVMRNASPTPFISYYDILDVFTLHVYSWSHNFVLEPFIKQPIELRHFLIPVIAIFGFLYRRMWARNESYVYFNFFSMSLVIFIFLGKQEFAPITNFYGWAFQNIPFFNLYRESSKFFIFVALPLAFFFGMGLFLIYKFTRKHNQRVAVFGVGTLLFFSTIFNSQHFVDQSIGGMAKGVSIPNDYTIFEKKLSNDTNFYRILWTPAKPRFGFYSQEHPFINAIDLPIIYNNSVNLNLLDNQLLSISNQITDFLKQELSEKLLDKLSVRYVVVPVIEQREKKISFDRLELVKEIYEHYGERNFFIRELDKLSYLRRIDIGTKDLVIYENNKYRPHIYMTQEKETIRKDVSFETVDVDFRNPTEYHILLKNVSDLVYVNFSEQHHPAWKVRVGDFHWFDVLRREGYFLPEKNHFKNDAQLNSFLIDPKQACREKANYCKNNLNGYDINLTLYFKPKSYFYLGVIISGVILLGCVGYLGWDAMRNIWKSTENGKTLLRPE